MTFNKPNMNWICSFFSRIFLLLLSEYFADKTLELFHRPKPKHEKSLSQYWLCKYCLPNKLDRPRINIEFFSYTTLWRASPLISCGSSPHFWGSFQTHRATRKKGCISICEQNVRTLNQRKGKMLISHPRMVIIMMVGPLSRQIFPFASHHKTPRVGPLR